MGRDVPEPKYLVDAMFCSVLFCSYILPMKLHLRRTITIKMYDRDKKDDLRTNNTLEGWHRRFNMIIAKHHPNIFEFLDRLKSEQAHTDTSFEQFIGTQAPKSQSRKVKCVNARINRIVQDYENRPILEYLR